ncbi:MAG: phytoene/squalene synthase family protein [Bryobacter sp.]|nr:phytoene/squalene synthase family protein [Bryobacter sp.]
MALSIEQSYEYCERVAREKAKNFYYSFLVLPKAKRRAMCAVYAFYRECDDLSDEGGAQAAALDHWARQLHGALEGETSGHAVWPAFADTVHRFHIPPLYFQEMIEGVKGDLRFVEPEDFAALYQYCYRVASVVGLTIVHIFGFRDASALALAEKCGVAFQLTNILRDVAEDASNGRVYLPRDLRERHGVMPEDLAADLAAGKTGEKLREVLRCLGRQAREYYEVSRPLIEMVERDAQGSMWALVEIYDRLLRRIEKADFAVMEKRHRLPTAEKLAILGQAFLR